MFSMGNSFWNSNNGAKSKLYLNQNEREDFLRRNHVRRLFIFEIPFDLINIGSDQVLYSEIIQTALQLKNRQESGFHDLVLVYGQSNVSLEVYQSHLSEYGIQANYVQTRLCGKEARIAVLDYLNHLETLSVVMPSHFELEYSPWLSAIFIAPDHPEKALSRVEMLTHLLAGLCIDQAFETPHTRALKKMTLEKFVHDCYSYSSRNQSIYKPRISLGLDPYLLSAEFPIEGVYSSMPLDELDELKNLSLAEAMKDRSYALYKQLINFFGDSWSLLHAVLSGLYRLSSRHDRYNVTDLEKTISERSDDGCSKAIKLKELSSGTW